MGIFISPESRLLQFFTAKSGALPTGLIETPFSIADKKYKLDIHITVSIKQKIKNNNYRYTRPYLPDKVICEIFWAICASSLPYKGLTAGTRLDWILFSMEPFVGKVLDFW